MNKTVLTPNDFEQIIHFATRVSRPVTDIRSNIQHELSRIFGYDESILWYADDDGIVSNPVTYRLSDKFLYNYLDGYYCDDFLQPKKNLSLFHEKKAVRLTDIVTTDQYENSTFYQSLMKPYGYYDEMGVALLYEGKFVGVLGMALKKGNYFSAIDCKRFQYLSEIIASVLVHQFKDELDYSMLSKREEEVVKLIKEGWTNQAIADELYISINTIKKHLQHIYQKHNVQNRIQLVQKLRF